MHPVLLFLHLGGVVFWVGGMAFAWGCLRPVAATQLAPPLRLQLWLGVFRRFFPAVWVAVLAILGSGLGTLASIGFAAAPVHWHAMMLLGLVMAGIFAYVFFSPYARLAAAVAAADWAAAAAALATIRRLVGSNLLLGIATIAVATGGRLVA